MNDVDVSSSLTREELEELVQPYWIELMFQLKLP